MNEKRQVILISIWEIWKFLLHSRFEIIIAFISVDGTWQINRMNGETRQGGIKRSMHKLYRARFWCTRDDRLVSLFFATRFDPIDRYSHFLPCAASPTNYAYPSGIRAWRRVFLPRIIEFQRRDEGAFVTLGETRPTLNESRSIGKLFDCQKDKQSSGEGESEKVRFQSDLDFFAGDL